MAPKQKTQMELNKKITANFTLGEFIISRTAIRLGLQSEQEKVTQSVIDNITTLVANVLEPLRQHSGPIIVNSGYRSPAVNKAIGGSTSSQHMTGEAADIELPSGDNRKLAELIVKLKLPFDQMILEFGTDDRPAWIHVSYSPRHRRQILRATKINGATKYLPFKL